MGLRLCLSALGLGVALVGLLVEELMMANCATVTWVDTLEEMPDDDLTVLIWSASSDQGVWIGYRDADDWRFADGAKCLELVTHWAQLPEGPGS